jgi:hypothetical protein
LPTPGDATDERQIWATTALLRSPAFHRAVRAAHARVHRFKHGVPPEELGGTKIERRSCNDNARKILTTGAVTADGKPAPSFFSLFARELRAQAGFKDGSAKK